MALFWTNSVIVLLKNSWVMMQKLLRIDEIMIENIFGGHSGGLVEKMHNIKV